MALVVALVVSLGVAIPAMAASVTVLPEIGITKRINLPPGTTTPASVFTFDFAQVIPAPIVPPATESPGYVVGNTTPAAPAIPSVTINFAADANPLAQVAVPTNLTWPHAGQFSFLITERTPDTTPASTNTWGNNETMNYDENGFILTLNVVNRDGGLVVASGYARPATQSTDDVTVWIPEEKVERIIPGIPGEPGENWVRLPSQIEFVNDFVRRQGPPNGVDPTNAALVVSKQIANDDAFENANLDTLFDFTLTLTAYQRAAVPAVPSEPGPAAPAIPALGLPETAIPSTLAPVIWNTSTNTAVTDLTGRDAIVTTVAADGATATVTFQLKHDEVLLIPTLVAGTTWAVTEAAHANFAPRAELTIGGAATPVLLPGPLATDFGSVNTALSTGDRILTDTGDNDGTTNGNAADFVNRYNSMWDTGLVVSSMPILVALIGATLALAMMVASRSRQRIEQVPAF